MRGVPGGEGWGAAGAAAAQEAGGGMSDQPDDGQDAPGGHWVTVADGPDAWIPDPREEA